MGGKLKSLYTRLRNKYAGPASPPSSLTSQSSSTFDLVPPSVVASASQAPKPSPLPAVRPRPHRAPSPEDRPASFLVHDDDAHTAAAIQEDANGRPFYLHAASSAPSLPAALSRATTDTPAVPRKQQRRTSRGGKFYRTMMGQFSTPQLERIDEDSLSTPPPVPPLPASFLRPAMVVGEPVDRDVTSPTDVVRPSPHVPVIKRPRTSSDAAKHLSLMTARLDSQISALGSVFGKIKAKQMEKSEKLRCGDGGCALVNPSASPSVSRLSISSYRTLNVSQSTSHLPFVSAAPPVSQLRRGSDARPLPPRTDSGFEKSELDLLFSDFRALSLGELAEKYGEGGEDDDQRVPAMEVMVL